MSSFFAMGGYAAFIWPAYGVSLLGLVAMIWQSWAAWRAAQKRLAALEEDKTMKRWIYAVPAAAFLVLAFFLFRSLFGPAARCLAFGPDRQAGARYRPHRHGRQDARASAAPISLRAMSR